MQRILKTIAYSTLDLLTAGRGIAREVNGERIRFPPRLSRFYPRVYEHELFQALRDHCHPGQTVMDLGAHLGVFSVSMARLVGPTGRVLSFEPTPSTRQALHRVIRLNGCQDIVEIRGEAVSAVAGANIAFYETGDVCSYANSLVKTSRSKAMIHVPTTTVDHVARERGVEITFLKIDVEGAELDVLRGARWVFTQCRPTASISLHPPALRAAGVELAELWAVLEDYGMIVVRDGRRMDSDDFCSRLDLFDVLVTPSGSP